jgi:hypothetical protein
MQVVEVRVLSWAPAKSFRFPAGVEVSPSKPRLDAAGLAFRSITTSGGGGDGAAANKALRHKASVRSRNRRANAHQECRAMSAGSARAHRRDQYCRRGAGHSRLPRAWRRAARRRLPKRFFSSCICSWSEFVSLRQRARPTGVAATRIASGGTAGTEMSCFRASSGSPSFLLQRMNETGRSSLTKRS